MADKESISRESIPAKQRGTNSRPASRHNDKLAEALRANLRKRKQQARLRKTVSSGITGTAVEPAETGE
jgi:hypothetical protein